MNPLHEPDRCFALSATPSGGEGGRRSGEVALGFMVSIHIRLLENFRTLRRFTRLGGLAFAGWLGCAAMILLGSESLIADPPSAPSIAWRHSTPMPEPRDGYAAGVIDGHLLLIGGAYWEGTPKNWTQKIFCATTHAFDPAKESWKKLPDAPVTLGYPASASLPNDILVCGGLQNGKPSGDIYAIRKVSGEFIWRLYSQLPEPRIFASAVTIGQTLFVLGGTREFEPFDSKGTCCTTQTARNTVWSLDTAEAAPKWKERAGYPGPLRWLHTAATDGTSLYLFGGIYQESTNAPVQKIKEVLRYDVAMDRWSRVAELPETMQTATACSVKGKVFLVSAATDVLMFDPKTAGFSSLNPLIQKASIPYIAWIDPFLVGAGGENEIEGPRRRSDWTFIGRLSDTPSVRSTGQK